VVVSATWTRCWRLARRRRSCWNREGGCVARRLGQRRGPRGAGGDRGRAGRLAALDDLHCGLILLANVCEEGEGNLSGMRHFCDSSPEGLAARAFLVLDGPNTDHITCSALESRRFEVTFTGTGGHSWSDFGIGNPVHGLTRAIAAFLNQAGAQSQPPSRSSFNFGVIEGGCSVNAIPSSARAKVDLRSETSEGVEELAAMLAFAVEAGAESENATSTGGKVAAVARLIGSRPGGSLPENASILTFLRAVDSHLGLRARNNYASTDANIPLSKGLQAVSIGAGGPAEAPTPGRVVPPRRPRSGPEAGHADSGAADAGCFPVTVTKAGIARRGARTWPYWWSWPSGAPPSSW